MTTGTTDPTQPAPPGRRAVLAAVGVAVGLTLAQVVFAACISAAHDAGRAYLSLYGWDGGWYRDIAERGYHRPAEMTPTDFGNVAFFPAYPLAAALVRRLLGVRTDVALLLTSQLACVGFWTYFQLLLRRWGVPPRRVALAVALIALHPASFFLVASYSESLFLCSVLGFLYWSESDLPGRATLTAAHGVVMTATRLLGVPLAFLPLIRAVLTAPRGQLPRAALRRGDVPLLIALVSCLGAASFFGYCQAHFGEWNLYMRTETVGWDVEPDYLAVLYPSSYPVRPVQFDDLFLEADYVSRLSSPLTLWMLLGLAAAEVWLARRGVGGWRERAALYVCAAALFWVPITSHQARGLGSLIRFSLCVHVLLLLAALHLLTRWGPARWPRWAGLAVAVWLTASAVVLLASAYRFTHGGWVA